MADISSNSSPAEQIVSAFYAGRSERETLDIGLRALIESEGGERGASFRTVLKLNRPVHGENPQQLGWGGVSESFLTSP